MQLRTGCNQILLFATALHALAILPILPLYLIGHFNSILWLFVALSLQFLLPGLPVIGAHIMYSLRDIIIQTVAAQKAQKTVTLYLERLIHNFYSVTDEIIMPSLKTTTKKTKTDSVLVTKLKDLKSSVSIITDI